MAEWWEMAVPATTTLLGTLSGGYLGARWQRRNSVEILERQFNENARVRLDQEHAVERARTAHFQHAERMRLLDRREAAYSSFRVAVSDAAQLWTTDNAANENRCRILTGPYEIDLSHVSDPLEHVRSVLARAVYERFALVELVGTSDTIEAARRVYNGLESLVADDWAGLREFATLTRVEMDVPVPSPSSAATAQMSQSADTTESTS